MDDPRAMTGGAGRSRLTSSGQSARRTSIAAMIEEITEMMIEPTTAEPKEETSSPSGTEPPAPKAAMWS